MVGPLDELTPDRNSGLSGLAQEWVYEQLIRVNDDGTLAPALAEKLERRGRGLHFVIRKGATFSDGSPVRPSDVMEALARHSLVGREGGDGISVEPTSGAAVEALLPFVVVGGHRPDGHSVGSGAFRVTEHNPKKIVLERIRPLADRIQRIELLGFATPREALARTLAGDADLLPRVEPRLSEFFEGVRRLRLIRGRPTQAATVAFNLEIGLRDRRALAALLSSSDLGQTAFGRDCPAWQNRQHSNQALSSGFRLDVLSPRIDVGYERLALAVRRALGGRGGRVQIVTIVEAVKALTAGTFQLFTTPTLVWPPSAAGSTFRSNSSENLLHYSDPRVDKALDASDWEAAQRALGENPPVVFICLQEKLVAVDSRIKNPRLGPLNLLEFVPDWEVSQ
jgi:hypothetical protein